MDNQDWTTVVMKKKNTGHSASQSESRTPASQHTSLMRKLDSETPVKIKSLGPSSRQAIVQARVTKSMNQSQLNTACAFPANTIRDIENGKVIPTPTQLNVLSRLLSIVLKYDA